MTIRFGISGCGTIAGFHARALQAVNGAILAGCASRQADAARQFAREHRCRAFDSNEELLADGTIDAICVCTPSGARLDIALKAARAGKHLVIEKPLEISPERCDRIIESCDKHGVRLATVFQSRFHPASLALHQAVDDGRFGILALGSASVKWFRTQDYYDSGAWRGTWELDGGGALMNQAIHSVDLLQWLMGPVSHVTAVTATRSHQRIEVEDTAVAVLQFANGALGTIEATTSAWPGWKKRIEICGSTGSVMIEDESVKRWQFASSLDADSEMIRITKSETEQTGGATDPSSIGHAAHTMQLQNFVDAINGEARILVDGREGKKSVEIISAIYQSAREMRPVFLAK